MPVDAFPYRFLLPATLCMLFWTAGCSGSRGTLDPRPDLPEAFPHHTLEQIRDQLRTADADTLHSLSARANLAIHTPAQRASLTAKMAHRRSDSLYLSLTAMLGIEAARMLVTPDSFFVYDRLKKQLNYGSLEYASAFLPAPLTGDDVFRNLLGLILPDEHSTWTVEADNTTYHLRDPSGRRRYIVDPTLWRVIQYEERTGEGKLLEARTFTEYDVFGGVYVPRRIILRRPLDDTSISIYYRDVSLNPETLALTMDVNANVERVLIDEDYAPSQD